MIVKNIKDAIAQNLPEKVDYFLACASYEDRCLSGYQYLEQTQIKKSGICYFKQCSQLVEKNLELLKQKFNSAIYELDHNSPIAAANAIVDFLKDLKNEADKPNIVIDISTFTRETLLIILRYIYLNKELFSDIFLFYRTANVSSELSEGVVSIRSVLGYMGDFDPEKPMHLILLSGFEYVRAREIIDTLEPDLISIGYGGEQDSINSDLYVKNKEFTDTLLAFYSDRKVNVFEHSLQDAQAVKTTMLSLIDPDFNSVVVPLNNKISTVGVALAANENRKIQLIYAQVKEYNEATYSECQDNCIIFKL